MMFSPGEPTEVLAPEAFATPLDRALALATVA